MDVTDMDILIKNVLIPCGDGTEKSNILIPFTPNVAPKIREHYMKFDAVRFIISKP